MASKITYNGSSYQAEEQSSFLDFPDQREIGVVDGEKKVDISDAYSGWMSETLDANNMQSISLKLINARRALGIVHRKQKDVEERLSLASSQHENALNKAMLAIEGGTAKERESAAHLSVHDLYENVRVLRGVLNNLNSTAKLIRNDIDILTVLSNNIRQELRSSGSSY